MFPSGGRHKHTAHQVGPDRTRLSLEGPAPIAREMQVEQCLRAAVFPSELGASLIVPVLPSSPPGPHAALDLQTMIMLLGRPPNNGECSVAWESAEFATLEPNEANVPGVAGERRPWAALPSSLRFAPRGDGVNKRPCMCEASSCALEPALALAATFALVCGAAEEAATAEASTASA